MLYFQLVIMAGTVMLAYYFEYTDTFSVHVQGFFCYDTAYTKPYLGPEDSSAVPPVLLYAVVAGLPTLLVSARSHPHTPPSTILILAKNFAHRNLPTQRLGLGMGKSSPLFCLRMFCKQ